LVAPGDIHRRLVITSPVCIADILPRAFL
jgi:hypothetical protein